MSFAAHKTTIDEGDTVILYLHANSMHAIDVHPKVLSKKNVLVENVFQTSFGALKVESLIGAKYGSKVELSRGWAYALQPTPELWTQTLPHRTQIIYTPDISMIVYQLDIRPGSVVIESGTGSGSLSHYFMRAVRPAGHLHTFDFHESRAQLARDEFRCHGLQDWVTVHHRDVCELGFTAELNGRADAVFLDLPSPHLAVPHALRALKTSGGRFCSFSPCIEQSQRVCETLDRLGFAEIQSMEVLQIEDIVKTKNVPVLDLDFVKHKKPVEKPTTDDINTNTDNAITKPADNKNDKDAKCREKPSWSTAAPQPHEMRKVLSTVQPATMPGHTGYLTFATLPPLFARNQNITQRMGEEESESKCE